MSFALDPEIVANFHGTDKQRVVAADATQP